MTLQRARYLIPAILMVAAYCWSASIIMFSEDRMNSELPAFTFVALTFVVTLALIIRRKLQWTLANVMVFVIFFIVHHSWGVISIGLWSEKIRMFPEKYSSCVVSAIEIAGGGKFGVCDEQE